MATNDVAEATRPKSLWPHLFVAGVVSLLVPGFGGVYLGLPPKNERVALERIFMPLGSLILWGGLCLCLVEAGLLVALMMAVAWLIVGAYYAMRDCRQATRHPDLVQIVPGAARSASIDIIVLGIFAVLLLAIGPVKNVRLFDAPQTTPVTAEGELLVGLVRSSRDYVLQRGQLIVTDIGGEPTLVRILAVPGDLFGQSPNRLHINGGQIGIRNAYFAGGGAYELRSLAEHLIYPAHKAHKAQIARNWSNYVFEEAKVEIPQDTIVLGWSTFVVARDSDLMQESAEPLPVDLISLGQEDEVIVPWAKFWSLNDRPGERSRLGQPLIPIGG